MYMGVSGFTLRVGSLTQNLALGGAMAEGVRRAIVVNILTQGSFDNTGHHFPIQHSSLSLTMLAFTVILVLSTIFEGRVLKCSKTMPNIV